MLPSQVTPTRLCQVLAAGWLPNSKFAKIPRGQFPALPNSLFLENHVYNQDPTDGALETFNHRHKDGERELGGGKPGEAELLLVFFLCTRERNQVIPGRTPGVRAGDSQHRVENKPMSHTALPNLFFSHRTTL